MAKLPTSKSIRELADLLKETDLSEIEVESGDIRIRVARSLDSHITLAPQNAAAPAAPAAPAEPEADAAPASAPTPDHPGALKSPMVGTAYLAPEPSAPDFVKVGDTVSEGQTLLIVEAMKTMNPIAAPRAGKVTQIIVNNEQPVEFDEVLMIIE
jgi:acetyl-CoA carboxylase biotin carboxyl carrier protein